MNYYVIVFNRERRELISLESFPDSSIAIKARFEKEMEDPGSRLEIVVLGAESEDALKRTHSRYFGEIQEVTPA